MGAVSVRPIEERDVERAGDVNFTAFLDVALRHGQPPTVTSPADSRSYVRHLLGFDALGGLVAEVDDEIVGMAWVHPRGPVATLGPVAVEPRSQRRGIGRALVERCLEIAGPRVPQVRLVHESFNAASLGLYLRCGFRVVAPLLELELRAGASCVAPAVAGTVVRPADTPDRSRLVERDGRAFGAPRPQSVDLYLRRGRALVAERAGAFAGYVFGIGFRDLGYLGSAAADDVDVLLLLVAGLAQPMSAEGHRLRILVAAGDRRLVDGLLALGFRVFRACQYLVRGGGTAPPPNYVLMNGDMM
ncbi:MAG: GNAT family N-acetyltransferase [bacterium]|nr:GNAT family N-acetyltransferase [bacterium]